MGEPWLQDPDVTLYHGDALQTLRRLPDRSVHMIATSPPFYGLRDYGTGEWEGGQPDCDHKMPEGPKAGAGRRDAGRYQVGAFNGPVNAKLEDKHFRDECGKCGARRVDQQIGLEETPDQWIDRLVAVFRECRRVLRDDGTLWIEIGDSYAANVGGHGRETNMPNAWKGKGGVTPIKHPTKQKDLLGQPWLLAFALRADGWYLRSEIIWARPNPMPESVTDRPTKSHSTVFLLSKSPRYFYDADAIREPSQINPDSGWAKMIAAGKMPVSRKTLYRKQDSDAGEGASWRGVPENGRNSRSVWTVPTEPTPFAHFATWPQTLVRRMIQAGTSEKGCCPKCGAPWVRETEREAVNVQATNTSSQSPHGMDNNRTHPRASLSVATVGWSPSCDHRVSGQHYGGVPYPVPCTVLDPFAGSGTTCLVARNHGRHAIGIELNQQYLKIAAGRLQQLSLLADGAT